MLVIISSVITVLVIVRTLVSVVAVSTLLIVELSNVR